MALSTRINDKTSSATGVFSDVFEGEIIIEYLRCNPYSIVHLFLNLRINHEAQNNSRFRTDKFGNVSAVIVYSRKFGRS